MNTQRSTTWRGYAPPTAANRATYKPGVAWDRAQPTVKDHTRRPQPIQTGCHPAFKPKVQPTTQNSQYNAYLDNMKRYSNSVPGPSVAFGRVQQYGQSKSFLNRSSRWTEWLFEIRDSYQFEWLTDELDEVCCRIRLCKLWYACGRHCHILQWIKTVAKFQSLMFAYRDLKYALPGWLLSFHIVILFILSISYMYGASDFRGLGLSLIIT